MNKKLHILFLSSWYPSKVFPTNGDFVQRHAESVANTHQVTLIHIVSDKTLKNKPVVTDELINNVRTIIIYVPITNPVQKLYRFFSSYISQIKKIDDFDMVHLNVTFPKGLMALYLKWFKSKPYIITEHWTDYQFPMNQSIGFVRKILTKMIVKNAAFVCPVSNHLEKAMTGFGLKGNYHSVPNIVNTGHFIPSNIERSNFTISHISHMGNEHKNVSGIINVIAKVQSKIPNLQFNLIGDNSKQYRPQSQELNIKNIQIIDQIPNNEVVGYLNSSDILILFSNYENLPCIILEAFSCGTAVISTDVGGIKEYFPKAYGTLIQPKDEEALEAAILEMHRSKNKLDKQKMHQYAVDHFGVKTISEQFSDLYFRSLNLKA